MNKKMFTKRMHGIVYFHTMLLWGIPMLSNAAGPSIETIDGVRDNPAVIKDRTPEILGICEEGSVVYIEMDNKALLPAVRCSYDNTFLFIPTKDIVDGMHDVVAVQTDRNNVEQRSTMKQLALNVSTKEPDYEVSLSLDKTTIVDEPTPIEVVITVSEFNQGTNKGNLIFTVTKNQNLKIVFDNSLSKLGGYDLSNDEWEMLDETLTSYQFKYKAHLGIYPPRTRMRIGLTGTFSPPANSRGKFILNVRVKNGSGDTNSKNNKDSDTMMFSNLK